MRRGMRVGLAFARFDDRTEMREPVSRNSFIRGAERGQAYLRGRRTGLMKQACTLPATEPNRNRLGRGMYVSTTPRTVASLGNGNPTSVAKARMGAGPILGGRLGSGRHGGCSSPDITSSPGERKDREQSKDKNKRDTP